MRTHRALAALHLVVSGVLGHSGPVAKLSAGTVHGGKCPNSGTKLFQGIPYAQPPVGKLRFMPPKPLDGPFEGGSFDATKAPPTCVHLYLDVYVPSNATSDSALPVKVWAYGGGNEAGALSYPLYNACNLAQDAIVVAFNYRLGPLGFLGLKSAGIKGNMAIQDYLAALQWVKANIGAFGGDVSAVVLFGQSAGGDDTFTVSTLPQAKSLISAAILESGGGQTLTSRSLAQYCGASYAETLKCGVHDLSCLQSKSVKDLIEALLETPALLDPSLNGNELAELYSFNLPNITNLNSAILDGEIIKEEPLKVGSQVPIIAGSTSLDSSLFVLPVFLQSGQSITESNYTTFLARWGSLGPVIEKQYPLSLFNTSGSTEEAVIAAITHLATASSYSCQTYRGLRAADAVDTPAYAYRFNHTPSFPWLWIDGAAFPGKYGEYFGATHTAELPFVFANLDNQPWGNGTFNATSAERAISRTLVEAWTAMAAKGSPSTRNQPWPRFDECAVKGLYVEDDCKVEAIDFSECQFWDAIWVELGGFDVPWPSKTECASNSTYSASPTKIPGAASGTAESSPSATQMTAGAGRAIGGIGMLNNTSSISKPAAMSAATVFPASFVQPWRELLESHRDQQRDDLPNQHVDDIDSLITTSVPTALYVGTGHSIYTRALLPAILTARHSVQLITCYWAPSPSLDSIRATILQLALTRAQASSGPPLRITIGFSSRGLFQKLFHTPSRDGHVYPPSQWPELGLPDEDVLAKARIELTVKSVFFTPFSVMHPKFVIVDGARAWVPSCNVSWERWFEGCVEVQGDIVNKLLAFYDRVWGSGKDSHLIPDLEETDNPTRNPPENGTHPLQSSTSDSPIHNTGDSSATQSITLNTKEPVPTIFLPSSHHRNPKFAFFPFLSHTNPPMTPLNAALLTLFANAQHQITILTPNVTSWPVVEALLDALARGVDVQIRTSKGMMLIEQLVTAGTTTSWCLRRFVQKYKALTQKTRPSDPESQPIQPGNLEILYYKQLDARRDMDDEPVVSHFKMTLVDEEYLILGSGNMDRASWWTSQELGLLFYMPGFQGQRLWQGVLVKRTEVYFRSADERS
ncbi:hypothetical protein AK830_g11954 [Neonectria ditissima]|uniref:PLD phosphodiesterase domain-containing protein n=1 Tax=Neonectria ditissima TaxID=78410 RepID=A0A0P7B036_9HYPO|nr:hypothetical protein AK830_g11954 [Neonectria ditissima]